MKRKTIYILSLAAIAMFSACDPIENRDSIGKSITAEQLDITATPIMVDGKKSNRVILENHSPVLSHWDYGTGKTIKQSDTILMVLPGEHDIYFTGYNPDGTAIEKSLTVTIDELTYPVPVEYGQLFGSGTKTWKWREFSSAWGMGGYLSDMGPSWWPVGIDELDGMLVKGEGRGASFTLGLRGNKMTKTRNDGTSENGNCELRLDLKLNKAGGGGLWSLGKLKTTITIPCGILFHSDNKEVFEYDIIQLTDDKLVLAAPETGAGAWGTCWYWILVPAE